MISEDELSSPILQEMTSTSLEDVNLVPINDQVTLEERYRECFRPLCQIKRIKSKGAILVLAWLFLTTSVPYLVMHNLSEMVNII